MKLLSAGAHAPNFSLLDIAGNVHRLSEALASGPAILIFYKASCPTTQLTLPYIQKILAAIGPARGCSLWGISQDDLDESRRFAIGFDFTVLIDEHPYAVSSDYGLEYVPSIFVVEPAGLISLSDYGFSKATLNTIARRTGCPVTLFSDDDGLPARRPGCRSKN